MKISTLTILCFVLSLTNAIAQDRYFGFVSQSNVIPKGSRQIEAWYANASGGYAFFNGNYANIGFKMGLGNNVLTVFFVNFSSENAIKNRLTNSNANSRVFDSTITRTANFGFSNELKIKLSDPVANPIGVALYNLTRVGNQEFSLAPRLVLDKRFGQNFLTFNFGVGFDWKWDIDKDIQNYNPKVAPNTLTDLEIPFEFHLGYMKFTKNNRSGFGFELRNHNDIVKENGWEHSIMFGGPAAHFRGENWFFNATGMFQIGNVRLTETYPQGRVLDEHQKFELRTVLGFVF